MEYRNPYLSVGHMAHVASGHCSAIRRTKAWCNGRKNHTGRHWALKLEKGERVTKEYWDSSENHPKPANK